MAHDEAEVTRISEARGKDGSTAYLVEGGKRGEGEASYFISKETFAELERQGKQALQKALQRGIDTSLASRSEPVERQ
jgi:hypothetical protein